MRYRTVSQILTIDHPILQAGMPWVSNPELAAAVSNAGALGILHPSAGMKADGDIVSNLRENIRRLRRSTSNSFGVAFYRANPIVATLIETAIEEGMRITITYGGSPALFTGLLKSNDIRVLHQVYTVRHARGAEAQGVDIIIAEGTEGGGVRGPDENSNLVLIPQVADAVSIPVIASGGIMDSRGYVAALALGANGAQMGTRFVATHQSIAHPRYKEALLAAIDTGTIIAGRYHRPTRLLRRDAALKIKDSAPSVEKDASEHWESELGPAQVRAALLDGDLDNAVAYCGAGAGLISDIMAAEEVVQSLVEGTQEIMAALR